MRKLLILAVLLATPELTSAAVPHHRRLWETGNRAAMGAAERAQYDREEARAQKAADAQLARARAALAAPVMVPEEPTDQVWQVRTVPETTCGESGQHRWTTRDAGGAFRRWSAPSPALWASSGCEVSRPRLLSHEEVVRRMNAQTEALHRGLSFDDLKGEMQGLSTPRQ